MFPIGYGKGDFAAEDAKDLEHWKTLSTPKKDSLKIYWTEVICRVDRSFQTLVDRGLTAGSSRPLLFTKLIPFGDPFLEENFIATALGQWMNTLKGNNSKKLCPLENLEKEVSDYINSKDLRNTNMYPAYPSSLVWLDVILKVDPIFQYCLQMRMALGGSRLTFFSKFIPTQNAPTLLKASVSLILGKWLSTISSRPNQACPLENFGETVDEIVRTRICRIGTQIESFKLDQLGFEPSRLEFPFFQETRRMPLDPEKIWIGLDRFFTEAPEWSGQCKEVLQPFFYRLIVERSDSLIEVSGIQDIIERRVNSFISQKNLLEALSVVFERELKNFTHLEQSKRIYALSSFGIKILGKELIKQMFGQFFEQNKVEMLKKIINGGKVTLENLFYCRALVQLADSRFVEESALTVYLTDGNRKVTTFELECLKAESDFIRAFCDFSELRSDNITLQLSKTHFDLFLKLSHPLESKKPLCRTIYEWKIIFEKAQVIFYKHMPIFELLQWVDLSQPKDLIEFFRIQEVNSINFAQSIEPWVAVRDQIVSTLLTTNRNSNHLQIILDVVSRYPVEEQYAWMHICTLSIPEGVFQVERLAGLKRLQCLQFWPNTNPQYSIIVPTLANFPFLRKLSIPTFRLHQLTFHPTLEILELGYAEGALESCSKLKETHFPNLKQLTFLMDENQSPPFTLVFDRYFKLAKEKGIKMELKTLYQT